MSDVACCVLSVSKKMSNVRYGSDAWRGGENGPKTNAPPHPFPKIKRKK